MVSRYYTDCFSNQDTGLHQYTPGSGKAITIYTGLHQVYWEGNRYMYWTASVCWEARNAERPPLGYSEVAPAGSTAYLCKNMARLRSISRLRSPPETQTAPNCKFKRKGVLKAAERFMVRWLGGMAKKKSSGRRGITVGKPW